MSDDFVRDEIEKSGEHQFRSMEAERAVLSHILAGKADMDDMELALKPEEFGFDLSGNLYSLMLRVHKSGKVVDMTTVGFAIEECYKGDEKTKYEQGMIRLYKYLGVYSYRNVQDWIKILKDLAARRKAIADFNRLIANLRDPTKDYRETLAEIESAASDVDSADIVWTPASEVALNTYNYIEKRSNGEIKSIPTGIGAIDRIVCGFFGGELTIVAARPGVGKSAFGLNIAMVAADKGYKVSFMSCEMTDTGFGQRMLSRESWVSGDALRKAQLKPEDWDSLSNAMVTIGGLPIDFMFPDKNQNRMTLESLYKAIRQKAKHGEVDILIVDYIGILQTERRFKENSDRVKYISHELKKLSMVANIPVIALCQVNREAHGSMPTMAQIRDSGAIEQDADGMIFIHRPENVNDPTVNKDDAEKFHEMNTGTAYLSVNVAKQRNGNTGMINLVFDPSLMRYAEITRTEEQKP